MVVGIVQCGPCASRDHKPVNIVLVIIGYQTDVHPAQGKQGDQSDK